MRDLLVSLKPDGDLLLAEISRHISDDVLDEIASADGEEDQQLHLVALRRLRDTGLFVKPISWYPGEVLELIRNSQPDDPSWKPGSIGIRGHWMRAFASAALLRSLGKPWEYKADAALPRYTLIQLILSLDALPIDLTAPTIRMMAWLMTNSDLRGLDDQVVYGVALLWFSLQSKPSLSDGKLLTLSGWIVRRGIELAEDHLLPWRTLGLKFTGLDLDGHDKKLQESVHLVGSLLVNAAR